jgi:hypothetical protein
MSVAKPIEPVKARGGQARWLNARERGGDCMLIAHGKFLNRNRGGAAAW